MNYNIYKYGSRVYGTHSKDSDHDFVVIHDDVDCEHHDKKFSINYLSLHSFLKKIDEYDIMALECLFLDKSLMLKEMLNFDKDIPNPIDLGKLRTSISQKASHSWVKAKKKFEVENDLSAARKSLFHSFRIINFGIQIAKYGKIANYSSLKGMWFLDFKDLTTEEWLKKKGVFKISHNAAMTEFRKLAPKGD